jgi:hypothetical protein
MPGVDAELKFWISPKTSSNQIKQGEEKMKAASKTINFVVLAAILVCLVVAGTGSALAADQVYRSNTNTTVTGEFPQTFGESVSISEPKTLKPAVVVWASGYTVNVADLYFAGLSVNGGACDSLGFGNRGIPDLDTLAGGDFLSISFQWVILPSDGVLVSGTNTFELCVGGESSSSDSITITHNTLTVQLM